MRSGESQSRKLGESSAVHLRLTARGANCYGHPSPVHCQGSQRFVLILSTTATGLHCRLLPQLVVRHTRTLFSSLRRSPVVARFRQASNQARPQPISLCVNHAHPALAPAPTAALPRFPRRTPPASRLPHPSFPDVPHQSSPTQPLPQRRSCASHPSSQS